MFGVVLLISLWVIYDYIRNLEKKAEVGKTKKKIGVICYMVTGIIGLFLFVF